METNRRKSAQIRARGESRRNAMPMESKQLSPLPLISERTKTADAVRSAMPVAEFSKYSDVRYIPLPNGYRALIDAVDAPMVACHKWFVSHDHQTSYALAKVKAEGRLRTVRMHRLILGVPPGVQVDHANRNGLDNRRANLRVASHSNNQHNRGLQRNNKSGYKGCLSSKLGSL